jgi:hypothetical protein
MVKSLSPVARRSLVRYCTMVCGFPSRRAANRTVPPPGSGGHPAMANGIAGVAVPLLPVVAEMTPARDIPNTIFTVDWQGCYMIPESVPRSNRMRLPMAASNKGV